MPKQLTTGCRRARNALQRRLLSIRYRHEIEQVRHCQSEVSRLEPDAYYTTYSQQELYYWMHIPRWIMLDHHRHGGRVAAPTCLDVGSAFGTLSLMCRRFLDANVYCVDLIENYLSRALATEYSLNVACLNIELHEVPWELKFDAIVFTEVLEHFHFHPLPTLRKLRRLLTRNGRIYLSTPDATTWGRITTFYETPDRMPQPGEVRDVIDDPTYHDHVYHFTRRELFELADAAELQVARCAYSPRPASSRRHLNATLVAR